MSDRLNPPKRDTLWWRHLFSFFRSGAGEAHRQACPGRCPCACGMRCSGTTTADRRRHGGRAAPRPRAGLARRTPRQQHATTARGRRAGSRARGPARRKCLADLIFSRKKKMSPQDEARDKHQSREPHTLQPIHCRDHEESQTRMPRAQKHQWRDHESGRKP